MVEYLAPGMKRETVGNVGVIHFRLCLSQAIERNRQRAAGKSGPFRMLIERPKAEGKNVGLRPAMRLSEEQKLPAGVLCAKRAEGDVMHETGVDHPAVAVSLY